MRRCIDRTWTVALSVSLLFHGTAMFAIVQGYIRELRAMLAQPPLVRVHEDVDDLIYIDASPDRPRLALGDSTGTGYAVNAWPGDESMLAREGPEDQAWLSRDPSGVGGDSAGASALRTGRAAPSPAVLPPSTETNRPFGVASTDAQNVPHRNVPLPSSAIALGEKSDTTLPAQQPANPQSAMTDMLPGGSPRAGDPAPMSDSDSDPFARIGSAEFRPGRVDVQLGRKHKITRPKLLLAGRDALLALRFPTLVLKISIDSAGNVSAVEVIRSSGSNEIDQPCQIAAYDWWFEPSRDIEGNAVPDVILFTIQWR